MLASARTLDALFTERILDLERSPLFDSAPTIPTGAVPWGRVEGMLLGLAVGDALGTTCEGSAPTVRGTLHGEVRDYLPSRFSGNLPYGLPSDDTQLAYWTLECLLEDGCVVPDHLLDVFAAGPLYGGGQTLHAALEEWQRGTRPWLRVAQRSAGNGALMRIAPVLLPSLARPSPSLWADTVLAAACTHNDRASTSACLAWVQILWQALQMTRPPAPDWWLDAYVSVARPLEGDSHYVARYGRWAGTEGSLWQYVARCVADAWGRGLAAREACDAWGSGAYLLETVPSVLYILMRHADDPEEAMVRAVNDTYDNDTVAAIVGTAVGALHGRNGLPVRWLDGLSGRTRADDSGHVFALLERARWTFGGEPPPHAPSGQPAGPAHGTHIGPTMPGAGQKPSKGRRDAPTVLTGDASTAPIPTSYWVLPGRLLAGEYPGHGDGALARSTLRALLQAGADLFVDLTEPSEQPGPYAEILAEQAAALGRSAEHLHRPIRDVSAPPAAFMADVLDAVDEALAKGRCVYVHCVGGIGRTGTVVGCWLVRHGMRADQALARVQALVNTTPKAGTRSPEVPSQENMVSQWAELDRPTLRERYRGCMLGLACGDALGTTIEFAVRGEKAVTDMVGSGPFHLQPGQWTDDTSMALCLAESLIERQRFDARDQMDRYVLWHEQGHLSSTGKCFDIGRTTAESLLRYQRTGDPYAGETGADKAGNGSLMRLAPLPMFAMRDARAALQYAGDSSRTTHAAPEAVDACRYFAGLIVGALRGVRKGELLSPRYAPVPGYWQEHRLSPQVDAIAAGSYHGKAASEVQTTGYVLHTLEAALWAFARTETFEEGVLTAVNLAGDADTTGAVYGQIAGAYYGLNGIPERWRSLLWRADLLTAYADGLYRLGTAGMLVS